MYVCAYVYIYLSLRLRTFFASVPSHVHHEVIVSNKPHSAFCAQKCFLLIEMRFRMFGQFCFRFKRFVACFACNLLWLMGFTMSLQFFHRFAYKFTADAFESGCIVCVPIRNVATQQFNAAERALALIALVRFNCQMLAFVLFQMIRAPKALIALCACKRALIAVYGHVPLQMCCSCERFITVGKGAPKWFRFIFDLWRFGCLLLHGSWLFFRLSNLFLSCLNGKTREKNND